MSGEPCSRCHGTGREPYRIRTRRFCLRCGATVAIGDGHVCNPGDVTRWEALRAELAAQEALEDADSGLPAGPQ